MVRFLTRFGIVALVTSLGFGLQGMAQQEVPIEHATPQQLAGIAKDNSRHFGDDPDDGGPMAKDLSPALDPSSVGAAMRKVADWQLERSQPYFDRIWTWSVLYSGFVAASDSLSDAKYRDAMEEMGKKFDWQLRSHLPDADDQSVGQTYLELYLLKRNPAMMIQTRAELDALLEAPTCQRKRGRVFRGGGATRCLWRLPYGPGCTRRLTIGNTLLISTRSGPKPQTFSTTSRNISMLGTLTT